MRLMALYLSPGPGGILTYYRSLKAALAAKGWKVLAVAAGAAAATTGMSRHEAPSSTAHDTEHHKVAVFI